MALLCPTPDKTPNRLLVNRFVYVSVAFGTRPHFLFELEKIRAIAGELGVFIEWDFELALSKFLDHVEYIQLRLCFIRQVLDRFDVECVQTSRANDKNNLRWRSSSYGRVPTTAFVVPALRQLLSGQNRATRGLVAVPGLDLVPNGVSDGWQVFWR